MGRTNTALLFAIVLLFQGMNGSSLLAADGPALIRHINSTARYEALMPAGAKDKTVKGNGLGGVRYQSEVEAGDSVFIVRMVMLSLLKMDESQSRATRDEYVTAARSAFIKQYGQQPDRERDVQQHNAKGKDFLFNIRRGNRIAAQVRERIIFDGQRLYTASLIGVPSTVSSTAGDRFLDSVGPIREVTQPKPKPPAEPKFSVTLKIPMKRRVDKNFGFEIEMPDLSESKQGTINQSLIAATESLTFGVASIKMGNELKNELQAQDLSQKSKVLKQYLATKSGLTPKQVRHRGLTGFEVQGDVKNYQKKTRLRAYLVDNGLHMLVVSGSELSINTQDADRFLNSFRLVNTSSKPTTESRYKNGVKYDVKY